MRECDVAVVGAGPSGLFAAREASKGGVSVMVLEEHVEVGVPDHCAGLVSLKGLGLLDMRTKPEFVRNEVSAIMLHSPSGRALALRKRETAALVLDRARFDKFLAEEATRAGAKVKTGVRVEGVRQTPTGLILETSEGPLKCKVLVDAEGVASRLASRLRLTEMRDKIPLPAFQYELEVRPEDTSLVHVYLGSETAPGFFAWLVPTGPETIRVGLACKSGNPLRLLNLFTRRVLGPKKPQVLRSASWPIVTGGPVARTYASRILLAGDVAGQAKPTTGGGVVTGGSCGMAAGRTASEAVLEKNFSARRLGLYQALWKAQWGRELRLQRLVRRVAEGLSDKDVEGLFEALGESTFLKGIEEVGDIDFQSGAIKLLLTEPCLLRASFKALSALLKGD